MCVEWAGVQPWSNGKVGLNGISYYAENQWQTRGAAAQAPRRDLPVGGRRRFLPRHGAPRRHLLQRLHEGLVEDAGLYAAARPRHARLQEPHERRLGVGTAGADGRGARRQPPQFLRGLPRAQARHRRLLAVAHAGLVEGQGAAVLGRQLGRPGPASARQLRRLRARRLRSRNGSKCHGLEHWTHFYTDYGVDLQKKFFGHFLKGEKTGWDKQPKVQLQVRHPGDKFVERHEKEWPLKRTQVDQVLSSTRRTMTMSTQAPQRKRSVTYKGFGDGVTFLTEPLKNDTEITGPIAAKLWVSSATEDADLFLVVRAFTPDLKEVTFQGALDPHTPIAQGWLRVLAPQARQEAHPALPAVSHPRRGAEAQAGRGRRVRRRGLADLHRGADGLSAGAVGARQGLCLSGRPRRRRWRRSATFDRRRPVHPRRSARPAAGGVRRRRDAARRTGPACLCAAAGHPEEIAVAQPIPRSEQTMSYREVSEVRDGMRIDWDMPITMDDGLVLRCDVFRPDRRRAAIR